MSCGVKFNRGPRGAGPKGLKTLKRHAQRDIRLAREVLVGGLTITELARREKATYESTRRAVHRGIEALGQNSPEVRFAQQEGLLASMEMTTQKPKRHATAPTAETVIVRHEPWPRVLGR